MGVLYRVWSKTAGENVFEITDEGDIRCYEIHTAVDPSSIPSNCKLIIKDSGGNTILGADHYGILYIADIVYTWVLIPFVTQISPANGAEAGGDEIVISGANFAGDATVTIDGDACTNVVIDSSADVITCDTPAGSAGRVALKVTNPNHGSFQIDNGFTYREAPTIEPPPGADTVSPSSGTAGVEITLTGTGFFSSVGSEPTVTINSQDCTHVVFYNSRKIKCRTPANANGTYDVVITFADGQTVTYTNGFTYVTSPTVGSVTPHFGLIGGGESVVIAGTGFVNDAAVTIGGRVASSVVVDSGTQITCDTPTHKAKEELVDVLVTNADGGIGILRNGFEYVKQDSTTLSDAAGVDIVEFMGVDGRPVAIIDSLGTLRLVGQVVIGL